MVARIRLLAWLLIAVAATAAHGALAQTAVTGYVLIPRTAPLSFSPPDADGVVWEEEFKQPGSRFVRVDFDQIAYSGDRPYEIAIVGPGGRVLLQVSSSDFQATGRYVTGDLPVDDVLIQVRTSGRPPSGLSFRIAHLVFSTSPPAQPYGVTSLGDDMKPLLDYVGNKAITEIAAPVARLSILVAKSGSDSGENISCTGFLISDDLLVTNAHCLSTQSACDGTTVYFGNEWIKGRDGGQVLRQGDPYRCGKLIDADPTFELDYAIVSLTTTAGGPPGKKWGYLRLDDRDPGPAEKLVVVEYPNGEPKEISATVCHAGTVPGEGYTGKLTDFGHTCATTWGSSGSPVVSGAGKVVGLHHLGLADPPWDDQNRAVRMHGRLIAALRRALALDAVHN
jgi:V8-like Glu-specific endopeptidase